MQVTLLFALHLKSEMGYYSLSSKHPFLRLSKILAALYKNHVKCWCASAVHPCLGHVPQTSVVFSYLISFLMFAPLLLYLFVTVGFWCVSIILKE